MINLRFYLCEAKDSLLNQLLKVDQEANPLFTEEELGDCYLALGQFLDTEFDYSPATQKHARNSWKILEFQSSWYVLRQYYPDEIINGYSTERRKKEFVKQLTENQTSFPHLYSRRDETKQKLEDLVLL